MHHGKINVWHHGLNHHGLDDLISDHVIPVLGEITKLISNWKPTYGSVIEISISQQKNKTCIQKLWIKYKSHNSHRNFTFFIETDFLNKEDVNNSE